MVARMQLLAVEGCCRVSGYEYAGLVLNVPDLVLYIKTALELGREDALPVDFRTRPTFKGGDLFIDPNVQEPLLVLRRSELG